MCLYYFQYNEIKLGNLYNINVKVEIGIMDYGFHIDGIIGIDFLKQVGSIIDLEKMKVYSRSDEEK